jgi:hypothetical protein
VPFDFLRRRKGPEPTTDAGAPGGRRTTPTGGAGSPTAPSGPKGWPGGRGPSDGPRTGQGTGPAGERGAPDTSAASASRAGASGGRAAAGAGAASAHPASGHATTVGVRFEGLTEDWRLHGTMHVNGRLSDALNRRETVAISDMQWSPIDGSGAMAPAPGLKSIDPYDLIAVLAGPDTLPEYTDEEKAARRVRKEPYQVVLEAPPFRIVGTVHVFPGTDPQQMLEQVPEMFIPLTGAVAYVNDRPVADPGVEVVLVNRLYVRGVEQTGR